MSKTLHFVTVDFSLASAERMMRHHQIRRLPVLDGEHRLVGILSLADVIRASAGAVPSTNDVGDVMATLATICAPKLAH
jgi:CBS domain-containing protein